MNEDIPNGTPNVALNKFFLILFGGLGVIFTVLCVSWGAKTAWLAVSPFLATGSGNDGTVVNGLTRTIDYTAAEEEDPIGESGLLSGNPTGPITASAFVVKDLQTGLDVDSRDSNTLLPIASLTKLVTAVIARDLISSDAKITVSSGVITNYGNTAGFRAGETFTAGNLLYPLLMVSSNETAESYARFYGRASFIQAMNDFVQRIGAYRTYFADPSGLSPKNESTASDMALILDWIRQNDQKIIGITELKSETVSGHTWVNPAHFLSWSNYEGGKNGYTEEADRTSAGLFELGAAKHLYAVIVLGSEDRDGDVIKLLSLVK